jgi:hypothetical protein
MIKTIGQVTALIPEASTADETVERQDGQSGDTDFPYAKFKALATVGEVDPETNMALAGWQRRLAEGQCHDTTCLPVRVLRYQLQ